MTVAELIAELEKHPQDMEVRLCVVGGYMNHTSDVYSVKRDKEWDLILGRYIDPEYVQIS